MALYGPTAVERAMKIQEVIWRAKRGELRWKVAAGILGVTERTIRRMRQRYDQSGDQGLLDKRAKRPSPKRAPQSETERILRLYREAYAGFNVRHFHQEVQQNHGVTLSYTFVKEALQRAGLVAKRSKRGRHFVRREPKACLGQMLHIDGSSHKWLKLKPEQRDSLIAIIDDATSKVLYAQLWPEETTEAILTALWRVIAQNGIPMSLYSDRASWAFYTAHAGVKVSKTQLTQVGRALRRLGIEHIAAYSPQARGRSERGNRTFQDRLVNELGRSGIKDRSEANDYINEVYLPKHNRNFSRPAANPANCFVSARHVALNDILCIEQKRRVSPANFVRYDNLFFQIEKQPDRSSCKGLVVTVRHHLDHTYSIVHGDQILGRYDAHARPLPLTKAKAAKSGPKKSRRANTNKAA